MRRISMMVAMASATATLAGCGGGGEAVGVAPAPGDMDAPAEGTLKVFAYGDTVPDEMLDPFREANPDVDLEVATFDSNKAAAAKLAGGFKADVVEVCTDEMEPLLARNLIRPLNEEAIENFDRLAFSDAKEVRNEDDQVLFVPASAGPHGLIANPNELDGEITSYAALFDPANAGNVALEATPLTAISAAALAIGLDDPMNLTDEEVEEAKQHLLDNRDNFRAFAESDSSMVNLFKSGEVALADGGRGTAEAMADDGLPVEWIAPDEGATSWVCGLAISSDAENTDAAYKLIDYYASAEAQAISAEMGFVAMNPDALELLDEKFQDTADPRNLETAIAQTEPENADVYDRAWQEVLAQ